MSNVMGGLVSGWVACTCDHEQGWRNISRCSSVFAPSCEVTSFILTLRDGSRVLRSLLSTAVDNQPPRSELSAAMPPGTTPLLVAGWLLLAATCSTTAAPAVDAAPVVQTTTGAIRGVVELQDGKELNAFYGVPFAATPMGELRFRPPHPHAGWNATLDCQVDKLGSSCPQFDVAKGVYYGQEDCL